MHLRFGTESFEFGRKLLKEVHSGEECVLVETLLNLKQYKDEKGCKACGKDVLWTCK